MKSPIDTETYEERLSIEVTNHCNSACTHCFVRANNSKRSSLSTELVKDIICEGYRLNYRRLHITGGEPLLWDGLFDALEYATVLGYKSILVNTNGTLLTKDLSKRLKEYSGLRISVSLQGGEVYHDSMRGIGSYVCAVKGINRASEAGLDLVVFTTVGKTFLPELLSFTDELYGKFPDIRYVAFIQIIRVKNDAFNLTHDLLGPDDFLKLVKMVLFLNLYGHKAKILNNPLASVVSKLFDTPWMPPATPLHRPGHIIVMANGNLTPSHSTWADFGKYKPGVIEKVLASDDYSKAVSRDETTCSFCEYFSLCAESGMIQPSEWFRDIYPEVPYCKRVLDQATLRI